MSLNQTKVLVKPELKNMKAEANLRTDSFSLNDGKMTRRLQTDFNKVFTQININSFIVYEEFNENDSFS
ncbi:uncharacterized protein V6R79_026055 [Siganus canaliculatus]